ncbi:MAG: DUF1670 domain-containing protein [Acidobacteriota bacterium]
MREEIRSQARDCWDSVYRRQISQQLYQEFQGEYAFPRAVCRSLSELFESYLDLYFGSKRKEGEIIFHGVSKEIPPGVKIEEMKLIPVRLTLYSPEDCQCISQKELLRKRILRLTGEAFHQGVLLTQPDLSVLLGESLRTIIRHIRELEKEGEVVLTRGRWKDIGPGTSHKKRIVELYLKGYEYTEISRRTKHSSEAILRYIKDFARVLILKEEGYGEKEIRLISGLSERVLREYLELIREYDQEEYSERLDQLREIYRKKRKVKEIQRKKTRKGSVRSRRSKR